MAFYDHFRSLGSDLEMEVVKKANQRTFNELIWLGLSRDLLVAPDMASTEFQECSQNQKLIRKITQGMTRLNSEKGHGRLSQILPMDIVRLL